MSNCHLIFCEARGAWAAALRGIAPVAATIVETRSLAAARHALEQAQAAVVAIHVTSDNLRSAIEFLLAAASDYPLARFAALLDAEDGANELLLREAGAVDVVRSVLELPRLGDLVHRQLARAPLAVPPMEEFVLARMPWKGVATSPTRS